VTEFTGTASTSDPAAIWIIWGSGPDDPPPAPVPARRPQHPGGPPVLAARRAPDGERVLAAVSA